MLRLFSNIQGHYWSGTTEVGEADYAWYFTFAGSGQNAAFQTTNFLHARAAHGGDVAAFPAPGVAWLLATGLLGFIARAWRKTLRARAAP